MAMLSRNVQKSIQAQPFDYHSHVQKIKTNRNFAIVTLVIQEYEND